jgi:hypothetical protein
MAERLGDRARCKELAQRKLISIIAVIVFSLLSIPPLFQLRGTAMAKATRAEKVAAAAAAELANVQQQHATAAPIIAERDMLELVKFRADLFIGNVVQIFNSVGSAIALTTLRAEVMGGDLRITCKAEAETYVTAKEFVSLAGSGSNVQDAVLVSTRTSSTLGPQGVSFEFMKKVTVGN